MLTCHLQLKLKRKTKKFFLDVQIIRDTAFDNLPISLVLFPYMLIDASEYAQVRVNYTLN